MNERNESRTIGFPRWGAAVTGVCIAMTMLIAACETSQPGVTNSLGTVRETVDATPAEVTGAAEQTLTDMGLRIITSESTDLDGTVVARTENNREINVRADRKSEGRSQISIRVGLGGDEQVSLAVLRRMRAHLPVSTDDGNATDEATGTGDGSDTEDASEADGTATSGADEQDAP